MVSISLQATTVITIHSLGTINISSISSVKLTMTSWWAIHWIVIELWPSPLRTTKSIAAVVSGCEITTSSCWTPTWAQEVCVNSKLRLTIWRSWHWNISGVWEERRRSKHLIRRVTALISCRAAQGHSSKTVKLLKQDSCCSTWAWQLAGVLFHRCSQPPNLTSLMSD